MSRYRGVERFCRYRTPVALMLDKVFGPAPEPTLVENFRLARNAVANVLAVPKFTINAYYNKLSGPAPFGIYLDVLRNSTFPGIADPEKQLSFWIEYGDEGSTYNNISPSHPFGNDRNLSMGWEGSHFYLTPGTNTIKIYVYDHRTDDFGYQELTPETLDADTFFAGKTICWSPSGDFTGAPAGSTQVTTFAAFKSGYESLGVNARGLLHAGEEYPNIDRMNFRNGGYYGLYGGDEYAVLESPEDGIASALKTVLYGNETVSDATVWGWWFKGRYDATTGTGMGYNDSAITAQRMNKLAIWRCKMTGYGVPLSCIRGSGISSTDVIMEDTEISHWQNAGVFGGINGGRFAGNKIEQVDNPLVTPREKHGSFDRYTADDTTVAYTLLKTRLYDGVVVPGAGAFDGRDALAVFDYDIAAKHYTELVIDVDFTLTLGVDSTSSTDGTHVVTLTSPLGTGHEIYIHCRFSAQHGPVRMEVPQRLTIDQNKMKSTGGWSSFGAAHQANIRWNSAGVGGCLGSITRNHLVGGFSVLELSTQNNQTTQFPQKVNAEANYLEGSFNTQTFIRCRTTGTVVTNNVGYKPNEPTNFPGEEYFAFMHIENWFEGEEIDNYPIDVYNNTALVELTQANGGTDTVMIRESSVGTFPLINQGNNLLYQPDRPTPLTDYTPLDLANYGRPQEGSAAIDAGTQVDLIWDDFAGLLVGETASIGAFDQPAAEVNQFFFDFSTGTIDTAPTDGTLKRNAVAGDYLIKSDGGVNVLRFQSTGTENARGMAFLEIDGSHEVEIYSNLRDPNSNPSSARLVFATSDAPDNEYGASVPTTVAPRNVYRRVSGTYTALVAESATTVNPALYYNALFKITPGAPNQLRFKYWEGHPIDDEPETWINQPTDSSVDLTSGGWIGMVGFDIGLPVYYKNLGIGIDNPAPRSPL